MRLSRRRWLVPSVPIGALGYCEGCGDGSNGHLGRECKCPGLRNSLRQWVLTSPPPAEAGEALGAGSGTYWHRANR